MMPCILEGVSQFVILMCMYKTAPACEVLLNAVFNPRKAGALRGSAFCAHLSDVVLHGR
jgi:hypothetical protein